MAAAAGGELTCGSRACGTAGAAWHTAGAVAAQRCTIHSGCSCWGWDRDRKPRASRAQAAHVCTVRVRARKESMSDAPPISSQSAVKETAGVQGSRSCCGAVRRRSREAVGTREGSSSVER
eukprot:3245095-Prymnesium_polylepis.1